MVFLLSIVIILEWTYPLDPYWIHPLHGLSAWKIARIIVTLSVIWYATHLVCYERSPLIVIATDL